MRKFRKAMAIAAAGAIVSVMAATPASAISASASTSFSNGATLTANVWMQTWASGNCGEFQTSAVINGGHNPVAGNDWVRNKTTFDPFGISPSVTAFGQSGDPVSFQWTNTNGSRGSYLSGTACTNWRTIGVVGSTTATAFYNGQTKAVVAST